MNVDWKALTARLRGRIPLSAVLVLAVGCLLLLIPAGSGTEEPSAAGEEAVFDTQGLERRLEEAVSRIEGAGKCRVLLTTRNGTAHILAKDREQDMDSCSERTVVIGRAGAEEAVSVGTLAPEFRGALVVCPGAGDPQVRLAVTQAVSVLTGLGADRICVTAGT